MCDLSLNLDSDCLLDRDCQSFPAGSPLLLEYICESKTQPYSPSRTARRAGACRAWTVGLTTRTASPRPGGDLEQYNRTLSAVEELHNVRAGVEPKHTSVRARFWLSYYANAVNVAD